jgi:hypothetical protein
MKPGALECSCGARIVGDPLGETPFQVRRYGPVMTAVGVTAAVVGASLLFSNWLAFAAVLPLVLSRRAWRLAKLDPGAYGGYRTAACTLILSLAGSIALASYAIIHIPAYIEKREIRLEAAERARLLHVANLLEQYRAENDGYPRDLEPIKKMDGGSLPLEFWNKLVVYKGVMGQVAAKGSAPAQYVSFELRLAGPDGVMGTEDDIVMRDGIFYSNPDLVKSPAAKEPLHH